MKFILADPPSLLIPQCAPPPTIYRYRINITISSILHQKISETLRTNASQSLRMYTFTIMFRNLMFWRHWGRNWISLSHYSIGLLFPLPPKQRKSKPVKYRTKLRMASPTLHADYYACVQWPKSLARLYYTFRVQMYTYFTYLFMKFS